MSAKQSAEMRLAMTLVKQGKTVTLAALQAGVRETSLYRALRAKKHKKGKK